MEGSERDRGGREEVENTWRIGWRERRTKRIEESENGNSLIF